MPRGFLVKRSRRPTPLSYRTRCCCPASPAAVEGGDRALQLPGLPLPPPPPPPLPAEAPLLLLPPFGTPDGPSPAPPPPPRSPARAVSDERSLPVGSPASAESFPAPEPGLLLGPGAELKLWAVAALAAAAGPPAVPPPPPPPPRSHGPGSKRPPGRKAKAARKLHFEDEVTTSPVLGLRIKEGPPEPPAAATAPHHQHHQQHQHQAASAGAGGGRGGGAPPLGEFICQLCKERYGDPLALAQHKCSRIVRVEYRCPECDKLFSCPANLASHRRWHKPRGGPPPGQGPAKAVEAKAAAAAAGGGGGGGGGCSGSERDTPSPVGGGAAGGGGEAEGAEEFPCPRCAKRFRRHGALRKHLALHAEPLDGPPPEEEEDAGEEEEEEASASAPRPSPPPPGECHPCPVCGEAFAGKSAQERHVRLLHAAAAAAAAQAFPCKYCPASFYSSPGLTRHINKCHPSENRQVILLQVPVRPAC